MTITEWLVMYDEHTESIYTLLQDADKNTFLLLENLRKNENHEILYIKLASLKLLIPDSWFAKDEYKDGINSLEAVIGAYEDIVED